ncbi:MAG: hypothetical protein ACFFEY_13855 [Candidatus Thorarchaeota archaeon]
MQIIFNIIELRSCFKIKIDHRFSIHIATYDEENLKDIIKLNMEVHQEYE